VTAHFAAFPLAGFAAATVTGAFSSNAFMAVMAVPAIVALWWEVRYVEKSPHLSELARSLSEESPSQKAQRRRAAEWYRWGSFGLLMLSMAAAITACIAVAPQHVSQ
jgi:hypothetical protein